MTAPTVAVVATARPTFDVERAQALHRGARDLLTRLGARLVGPEELVMTPKQVAAAGELIGGADLVVNVCASFSDALAAQQLYRDLDAPVLLWAFREPGRPGDRLRLNSLCGANLFAHAIVRDGGSVRLVYGDPDEAAVADVLTAALRGDLPTATPLPTTTGDRARPEAVRATLEQLRGARIGIVGDPPTGFTPSEFDAELLQRVLGISVQRIEVEQVFSTARGALDAEVDAELADATRQRPTLATIDTEHQRRFAAVTTSLRGWGRQAELSALAVRCWPEFPTELGVCPCSSLSRLADEGLPTACERDVYGSATMLLIEALGGGTTYLVDTVELDADAGLVRLWHCGSAATALAADPAAATQSVHCNRRIGVAGDFPLATGPVVLARLTEDVTGTGGSGLRLALASGESVPETNRFQGNTAAVRVHGDATALVHGLVEGGFPHHTVLAWTDVRPELRAAADLLDIPVTEW